MSGKQHIESWIALLLIAIMPVMMLTHLGHSSGAFLILAVLCLIICFTRPGGFKQTWQDFTEYRVLAIALAVPLLTSLALSLWQDKFLASDAERGARTFGGTVFILAAFLTLIPDRLRQAAWGITLGAWSGAGYAIWLAWPTRKVAEGAPAYNTVTFGDLQFRRPENVPEYNAVSYGNLLLLMTVISTLSIGWQLTRYRKTEIAFKVLTAVVGFIGFLATQTRSGWVGVPFFILIGLVLFYGKFSLRKIVVPAIVALSLIAAVFVLNPITRTRTQDAINEITECARNPVAVSSVCVRIQLWHASIMMFKQNPLIGNGSTQKFRTTIQELAKQGVVSGFITTEEFDEPHNDMMYAMASYGLLGMTGLLLLYFAPGWIFIKRLASDMPHNSRVAAAMGLAVCIGFFTFGLTELMFRGMRTMGFYAAMMGWLLALSDPRMAELDKD
mgnify:FL=1